MIRKKAMLAQPVGGFERITKEDWRNGLYIQPKLDGVRCLIQYDAGVVTAWSRTGKEWKNIEHIKLNLYRFFDKYPNHILDGELYNHELKNDFEKIISLVRKTKPTEEDRLESAEMVQFHCYDTIMEHWNFSDRNSFIQQNFSYYGDYQCGSVVAVDYGPVFNTEEVEVAHEEFLDRGYEGSILRKNERYECKRSWSLMKVKDFSDAEAYIVGYEEGKGKRVGTLGKFIMQDEDGNKFGCPPGKGYNYQDMRNMLRDIHKYMGQVATFTYFERTKKGSYRHPLFKTVRDYE